MICRLHEDMMSHLLISPDPMATRAKLCGWLRLPRSSGSTAANVAAPLAQGRTPSMGPNAARKTKTTKSCSLCPNATMSRQSFVVGCMLSLEMLRNTKEKRIRSAREAAVCLDLLLRLVC